MPHTLTCLPPSHRIVVRIDSWEVDSQYPNGHFVRSIGPIGSLETETQVILIEHGLCNSSFSKALLNGECVTVVQSKVYSMVSSFKCNG